MKRFMWIVIVTAGLVLVAPAPVRAEDACDSWLLPCLGSILGIDKYNEEQTEQAEIDAAARVQVAGIEGMTDVVVAGQETQRVLIAETQATVRRALELPYELQKTQIENQADVAIQGIVELGQAKRAEIIWEGRMAVVRTLAWGGVGIVVLALLAVFGVRRQAVQRGQVVYRLEGSSCTAIRPASRSTISRY